jgi:cardiolipin synthase
MRSRIFTVPNQLSFLRLGFLPFFIILIIYGRYGWALALLAVAGLTDGLDGLMARLLNQGTTLGALLDPIADKLLLSSSFFVLALKGKLHWWMTILVLSRDVLILTTVAVVIIVVGQRQFPPTIYGKITTFVQIVLVFAVLVNAAFARTWMGTVEQWLIYIVAAFTVFSGFHYSVILARRLQKGGGSTQTS